MGELIINRSSLEQRMNSFRSFVDELEFSLDRLRRIAQELETHYEVAALAGRLGRGMADQPAKLTKEGRFKAKLLSLPSLQVSRNRLDEFDELEFDRYTEFHLSCPVAGGSHQRRGHGGQ